MVPPFLYFSLMKAILSIVLSLLILLSSSGVAYAKHYCGGFEMLSKVTLGEEHLSCGMKMNVPACGDEEHEDHSCCSNRYLKVHTDNHFAKVSFDFDFATQWIPAFVTVFIFPKLTVPEAPNSVFTEYLPPPLEQDIQILYETFLI